MKMSHKGMGITKADYAAFMRCLSVTLDTFEVREPSAVKSQPLSPAWNLKLWRHSRSFTKQITFILALASGEAGGRRSVKSSKLTPPVCVHWRS
jgi:hypothetical protein